MKLIIGLGNPGKQYELTRHNAGFIVVDELQKKWQFPAFNFSKKFNALVCEGMMGGEKIILAKPETFMNLSGQSVRAIIDFYKIPLTDIVLIHDDLDIELGAYKISLDSSAAGHNGVASIFDTLGTQQIKRIRIGIEGAAKKKERQMAGSDFVLQKFTQEELAVVAELAQTISQEF